MREYLYWGMVIAPWMEIYMPNTMAQESQFGMDDHTTFIPCKPDHGTLKHHALLLCFYPKATFLALLGPCFTSWPNAIRVGLWLLGVQSVVSQWLRWGTAWALPKSGFNHLGSGFHHQGSSFSQCIMDHMDNMDMLNVLNMDNMPSDMLNVSERGTKTRPFFG